MSDDERTTGMADEGVTNRQLYEAVNGLGESLRDEMRDMRREIIETMLRYRTQATCDALHAAINSDMKLIRSVGLWAIGVLTTVMLGLVGYIWINH